MQFYWFPDHWSLFTAIRSINLGFILSNDFDETVANFYSPFSQVVDKFRILAR